MSKSHLVSINSFNEEFIKKHLFSKGFKECTFVKNNLFDSMYEQYTADNGLTVRIFPHKGFYQGVIFKNKLSKNNIDYNIFKDTTDRLSRVNYHNISEGDNYFDMTYLNNSEFFFEQYINSRKDSLILDKKFSIGAEINYRHNHSEMPTNMRSYVYENSNLSYSKLNIINNLVSVFSGSLENRLITPNYLLDKLKEDNEKYFEAKSKKTIFGTTNDTKYEFELLLKSYRLVEEAFPHTLSQKGYTISYENKDKIEVEHFIHYIINGGEIPVLKKILNKTAA